MGSTILRDESLKSNASHNIALGRSKPPSAVNAPSKSSYEPTYPITVRLLRNVESAVG